MMKQKSLVGADRIDKSHLWGFPSHVYEGQNPLLRGKQGVFRSGVPHLLEHLVFFLE